MNARTIATFAVAILLGLIAVLLVRGYLVSSRNAAQPQLAQSAVGTTPIVVAAKPIERGVSLTPDMLRVVRYPADATPANDFQNVAQLVGPGQTGRLALRSLSANEPILADWISGPGGKLTLSTTLDPGMRAVSLRSSDVAGVAGFVLPGDRVDILLTRTIGGGDAATTVTQVLAENVLVLGVDQLANTEADKPVVAKAVTVEVTPEQAEAVSLAQAVGQVSFALRHVADDAALPKRVMTVADLGFAPRPASHVRPAHVANTVDVRVTRGVATTGYTVGYW